MNPPSRTFKQPIRLLSQSKCLSNYILEFPSLHNPWSDLPYRAQWNTRQGRSSSSAFVLLSRFWQLLTSPSESAHFLITLLKSISCVPADLKIRGLPLWTESFSTYVSRKNSSVMVFGTPSKFSWFCLLRTSLVSWKTQFILLLEEQAVHRHVWKETHHFCWQRQLRFLNKNCLNFQKCCSCHTPPLENLCKLLTGAYSVHILWK